MKNSLIAGLMVLSVVSPTLAFANPLVQEEGSLRMGAGAEVEGAGLGMKAGYDVKANVKARTAMTDEEWDKTREERHDAMEDRMEARRAAIEKWHTELKTRLAAWKDKTKAEIAERIQANLDKLNERLTAHFDAQLDKLVAIMVRVEAGDTDNSGDADIKAANEAIVKAQKANDDQADNTYEVKVSTEANAKLDVGAARQELHDGLMIIRSMVSDAREAVRKAASHVDKPAASASADASAEDDSE